MAIAVYQSIPVDQITPSRHQVRKNFTEESIQSLAESMKQEGQLMPIIVRRQGDTGTGGQGENAVSPSLPVSQSPRPMYELVVGERRWRAAKFLGWKEIDAKVIETVSEAAAAAKGFVENLQREDLDPIEEAKALADLNQLDPGYWTQDKIAEVSGKSKSHISESLRFLEFPEQIQGKFRQRNLTHEHGAELLRLPTPESQQKVADAIVSNDLTVKKTRDLINKLLEHKPAVEKAKPKGRPRKDPLASLWPGLLVNEAIPGTGAWAVAFKKGKWNFAVDSSAISSQEALATWFKQMGEAIHSTPLAHIGESLPAAQDGVQTLPAGLSEQASPEAGPVEGGPPLASLAEGGGERATPPVSEGMSSPEPNMARESSKKSEAEAVLDKAQLN